MKEQESANTLLMPDAEVIEKKLSMMKRINELYKGPEQTQELSMLEAENYSMNLIYDFYDREFEENGLVGLKDFTGKVVVPAMYKAFSTRFSYDDFREFPVSAQNKDGKFGLVKTDGTGDLITKFKYDFIDYLDYSSLFIGKINGKCCLLTALGKEITPFEFDQIYAPFNDVITLKDGDKFGLFTLWGLYVKPQYDEMDEKDEIVYVRRGNEWGFLDGKGNFINENDQETIDNTYLVNFGFD